MKYHLIITICDDNHINKKKIKQFLSFLKTIILIKKIIFTKQK
jgi:hypothetical protein